MNPVSLQTSMAGQNGNAKENPRLVSAAHEFEASLMQELLKPLQQDPLFAPDASGDSDSLGDLDSGAGDDQGSGGALMSLGSEALAKAISERGGFGIATRILDHFRTVNQGTNTGK
jgi:hypothetical protein